MWSWRGRGRHVRPRRAGRDRHTGDLEHHVRFTCPFEGPAGVPAWIDSPDLGLHTYQHRSGPGRWSVGGASTPS